MDENAQDDVVFVRPEYGSALATAVINLGDSQSKTLGHFPYSAWEEAFRERRVLAAVRSDALIGYVLFRLPRNEVTLVHLAVRPDARGQRVASKLLDELRFAYRARTGIRARCRRDYEAHNFWPHYGFVAQANLAGRSAEKHELTLWWLDQGATDLTSWAGTSAAKLPVLIDVNVFLARHGVMQGGEEGVRRALLRVEEQVEFLIAPETHNELNKNPQSREREQLLGIAMTQYPRIPIDVDALKMIEADLRNRVNVKTLSDRDQSDLRHVATAIVADIPILVTRDRKAKNRFSKAAWDIGQVVIIGPDELIPIALSEGDPEAYVPASFQGTGLRVNEAAPAQLRLLPSFVATAGGERRQEFEAELAQLTSLAPASSRQIVTDADGEPLALVGAIREESVLRVPLLRVRTTAVQATLGLQLVGGLRQRAQDLGCSTIQIVDRHLSQHLESALRRDGYWALDREWLAVTLAGAHSFAEISRSISGLQLPSLVESKLGSLCGEGTSEAGRDLEHLVGPARIVDVEIPTWLVSIRSQYADDLFGYPGSLIERPTALGLGVEHVYYRGGQSGEQAPGRVLWRLTGQHEQGVFACSTLVEVRDGQPQELHRKFQRLGVWGLDQILKASGRSGKARALRVARTQILPRTVGLARLRAIATSRGQSLQLQSPCRIQMDVFEAIMREATCG